MQPLVVNDIVRESWNYFLPRWKALAQAAALPFVLLLLFSVLARGMMGPVELPEGSIEPDASSLPSGIGALFAVKLLEGLVLAALAVVLHRSVLMDEPLPPVLWIDGRSLRYAWRAVGLLLVSALPTMLILLLALILGGGGMASVQLAILPSMLATLFVLCRLHPVLTTTAVDLRSRFGEAWERTKGQGLRLMLGAIVLLVPVMVGGTLALLIVAGNFEGIPILQNLPQAVALVTDLLEAALLAIYFSFIWRRLSPSERPATSTSA